MGKQNNALQVCLNNKEFIVTGAAGLLGKQFSKAIIEAGGRVILVNISQHLALNYETVAQSRKHYGES
ncbi:hypothetical protein [Endozoicomonas sp. ONNA1]|uniref:hypothetical protein n=1 Tax=Endozoicomonas sp. ONNA1 TaxID=2828740 RepID=UPI002148269B|nr:hypothetical protein [Endozoicomonas sp. ONNA1]